MRDQMLNVNVSPKSKIMQYDNDDTDALCCDGDSVAGGHQATCSSNSVRLGHKTVQQKLIAQSKSSAKLAWPRSSTLMKPTASHLAKRSQPSKAANSRCQLGQFSGKGLCSSGAQSIKRQKLEGGELCKVFEVEQEADFVQKASKKGIGDKRADYILKLRETSPEPFKQLDDLTTLGLSTKQIKNMFGMK